MPDKTIARADFAEYILIALGLYREVVGVYNKTELLGFAIGWFKPFDDILLFYLDEILIFK